jgi:site-specific recombinase XerD
MQKKAPACRNQKTRASTSTVAPIVDAIEAGLITRLGEDWILDCKFRGHSPRTLEFRHHVIIKFAWFLEREGFTHSSLSAVKAYLAYVQVGHLEPKGRWDNPHLKKPVASATVHRHYRELRTWISWLVREGYLTVSPMERMMPPVIKSHQVQPFTDQHIADLLRASSASLHPKRDTAILLMLLDTGVRASELCSLKRKDIDFQGPFAQCSIMGKGGKRRTVYLGRAASKALWQHLREQPTDTDWVFTADRGKRAGEPLTRTGLLRLMHRLGKVAGIQSVRCSPHTFRHTFAVSVLRNGGNTFSLQQMLRHTSLAMTQRYVALAQADLENQARQFSPADRIARGDRR